MKVMKTLKSLKFWSKKKKKKKINNLHHQSPPPCCYHQYHHPIQPSAPPLPTWLDYEEQTYNQHLLSYEVKFSEFSGLPVSYQAQIDPQEDGISDHDNESPEPVNVNPPLLSESGGGGTGCVVEKPDNGVPVLQSRRTERSSGGIGCVFNVGAYLFRCFFPCFHIREV